MVCNFKHPRVLASVHRFLNRCLESRNKIGLDVASGDYLDWVIGPLENIEPWSKLHLERNCCTSIFGENTNNQRYIYKKSFICGMGISYNEGWVFRG